MQMASRTSQVNLWQTTPPPPSSLPSVPPGSANISIREYIFPLPYPLPTEAPIPYSTGLPSRNPLALDYAPSEPTDTLVLTSPRGTYVDIRILKPLMPGDTALPNDTLADEGKARERLEWAFAGTSYSTPVTDDDFPLTRGIAAHGVQNGDPAGDDEDEEVGEEELSDAQNVVALKPTHRSTWHHWLDSEHAIDSPHIPLDSGLMFAVPRQTPSSPEFTLEFGTAFSPRLDRMTAYEELWRDIAIQPCSPSSKKVCIVLRTEGVNEFGDAIRGVVVRLGRYCQGILRKGDTVTVERWEFKEGDRVRKGKSVGKEDTNRDWEGEDESYGGTWERTVKIGREVLPCMAAQKEEELDVTMQVSLKGYVWVVEELVEWED